MQHSRASYFQYLKQLAQQIRQENNFHTYTFNRTTLKNLCKQQGVDRIDLWPPKGSGSGFKTLRGAYFYDTYEHTILLSRKLPDEPAIFTLAHELKHHLVDQELLAASGPLLFCDTSNIGEEIEIGAEIFAAELLFPDKDFLSIAHSMGPIKGSWQPADIVRFKHETGTILSYSSLSKRAELFGLASPESLSNFTGWIKLQEQLYGVPLYKQLRQRRG